MIIVSFSPRRIHQAAHLPYATIKAAEYGFTNQEMANIEFGQLRDGGYGRDIVKRQTMTGMGFNTVFGGQCGGIADPAEFGFAFGAGNMCIMSGVKFDDRRAEMNGGFDLARVRFDEQAYPDICIA